MAKGKYYGATEVHPDYRIIYNNYTIAIRSNLASIKASMDMEERNLLIIERNRLLDAREIARLCVQDGCKRGAKA